MKNSYRYASSLESQKLSQIPLRSKCLESLKSGDEYDVLVIGGGSTGAGAALDAASRGLKIACVEREDFASGTSSRSTKLIWGGSRYLVQALVSLFHYDLRLLRRPRQTIQNFLSDFRMVLNCHKERKFLLETQAHLTNWLPIAVPITKWILWPPPFGYPPAALGPLGLFPLFFKFYDSLSGFTCPPSHLMTKRRALRKFPQLANHEVKYSPIFYEGQHDDARTNLAIALTAAQYGADIVNYVNIIDLLKNTNGKVIGAIAQDTISGDTFNIYSKSILFCGGPFTDELRQLEDTTCTRAVQGAGGIHIVLPSYYAPAGIGLVDMNTSDGRFLFFLPWMGHVLVGTTDRRCEPSMRPEPEEGEIRWLLNEAAKYLHPELKLRRQDVLSAWNGIRPLAVDPNTERDKDKDKGTSAVSRDHVISYNPDTGLVFISGGKWTTYREMAEDAVDKLIEVAHLKPERKSYSSNLSVSLIQEFGLAISVAQRLAAAYGGRARDVCIISRDEMGSGTGGGGRGRRLVPGFPIIEAEVVYAARHEWANHADDVIARRTRLAFLNKEAALLAIPRVVQLMAGELDWDVSRQQQETKRCVEYMRHFGGQKPSKDSKTTAARIATVTDITDVLNKLDTFNTNTLDIHKIELAGELLGHTLSEEEINACIEICSDFKVTGIIPKSIPNERFIEWWNSPSCNAGLEAIRAQNIATSNLEGSGAVFG
eukprot:gene2525-4909_t